MRMTLLALGSQKQRLKCFSVVGLHKCYRYTLLALKFSIVKECVYIHVHVDD